MPNFRKPTDVVIEAVDVFYLPIEMRMPLKFGAESVSSVNCIRVAVTVQDQVGTSATGWGETPLSVTWAWPSSTLSYGERYEAMVEFCCMLAQAWADSDVAGHALEIGHAFLEQTLPGMLLNFNHDRGDKAMPHLAALIAASAFDLATHDAYGMLHDVDIYETYTAQYLSDDLSHYLTPQEASVSFVGKYPRNYLVQTAPTHLPVWHLVGGLDPLEEADKDGSEPHEVA
jgi:hypothetical protein